MDLVQIGKFIAELRKEQELTQEQLGEKIGVTNKTISRWENGNYLPPADVLLAMSQLFNVSVNEILSGKRLLAEEYKEAAEMNLAQTLKASSFSLKERIDFYKSKWLKEHISIMVFIGICIIGVTFAGIVYKQGWIIFVAILLLLVAHGWRNNTREIKLLDYDADHYCRVYGKVIDCDLCYESVVVLKKCFKVESLPELKEVADIEEARRVCASCIYSDLQY